ncbi:MAG: hypothetical protein V2I31_08615 [Mariniphaga sp.]|nr:hypothetical protein [Mariniphaga sp.]
MIKNRNSQKKQQLFIDAFPSTFDEFYMTYRYCPDKGYDLSMYYKATHHILNGLANLNLVPDSVYFDKLIWLSLGGQFYPDAPNYLKKVLRQMMKEKQSIFFQRLNNFSDKQLISFWYFYFHSRFEKDYKEEYERFGKLQYAYPKVIKAMEIAYPASCGKVWY